MISPDFEKRNCFLEIFRCRELFNSQALVKDSLLRQSAFIEILIRLNHVLQFLNKKGKRVAWKNHVQNDKNVKDITDLVNGMRNAACHIESPENFVRDTKIKFVFNVVSGKIPKAVQIGENIFLGCDFKDDTAFYYGDKKIYLVRHLKKLLEELPEEINQIE